MKTPKQNHVSIEVHEIFDYILAFDDTNERFPTLKECRTHFHLLIPQDLFDEQTQFVKDFITEAIKRKDQKPLINEAIHVPFFSPTALNEPVTKRDLEGVMRYITQQLHDMEARLADPHKEESTHYSDGVIDNEKDFTEELLGEEKNFVENFESISFEDMTDKQKREAKNLLKQEYLAGAEMSYLCRIDEQSKKNSS